MTGEPVPQVEVGVRPDLVEVRLVDLPLSGHRATAEHLDELRREFRLLQVQEADQDMDHVPTRLLRFIAEIEARYEDLSEGVEDELDEAEERGQATIDLRYLVPPDVREAVEVLDALLEEADDFCRQGDTLLTLQASDEVKAYRRWYLREFIRQLDGLPPTPFPAS